MYDPAKIEGLLQNIFPATIAVKAVFSVEKAHILTKNELIYLKNITAKERAEGFIMGRIAAHETMNSISLAGDILRHENGSPNWPDGITGSISHKNGIAIAAVGQKIHLQSIGLDVEKILIDEKILVRIAKPEEQRWINEDKSNSARRLTQLFAAKEALYKALFPLTKTFFGFKDATLLWENDSFNAHITKTMPAVTLSSQYKVLISQHEDLVFAGISISN